MLILRFIIFLMLGHVVSNSFTGLSLSNVDEELEKEFHGELGK